MCSSTTNTCPVSASRTKAASSAVSPEHTSTLRSSSRCPSTRIFAMPDIYSGQRRTRNLSRNLPTDVSYIRLAETNVSGLVRKKQPQPPAPEPGYDAMVVSLSPALPQNPYATEAYLHQ